MDWIKIEDSSRFLNLFEPQMIHPDDPRWIIFWRGMKKLCIEGAWFEDFGKWRYGRGNLGFYRHYCRIPDLDRENKIHGKMVKPLIRDLEWHFSYYMLEAMGFSGFSEDEKFTSDKAIFHAKKTKLTKQDLNLFKPNGEFKEYIEPRDNIFRLHDSPVGLPLYNNEAKNILLLGTRGGGKSLFFILGEIKYAICFDGLKRYDEISPTSPDGIKINVGSGIKSKSAATLDFMKTSMDNLKRDPTTGVWGKPGDDDWEPCPFYKEMAGSFDTDNEAGWRNAVSVKKGNDWEVIGTGSAVYHKAYSANKRTGAESGAGGRRSLIMYEEVGLFEDLQPAWGSDEAVASIDGEQFAPRIGIGTSGNIDTIKPARHIFTHPKEYKCLSFKAEDGESEQGLFLPAYMVDKRFKDENGNTDIIAARAYYDEQLEEKLKTNDSSIINAWKMNYPTKVEHMWVSKEGELLPSREAEIREKELLKNNLYESIGFAAQLTYDPQMPNGVRVDPHPEYEKFRFYDDNFGDMPSIHGCVVIYEQPFKINGVVPPDAHIITHDPYISDAWDEGGSIGVTHVWIHPKYISKGAKGGALAATYIGKHQKGLDGYNEELEKLIAYYGNPFRGLWYEANRGERLRSYMLKKNKGGLLCLQPQFEQGTHIYLKNTQKTGFMVGSQVSKIAMLDRLNDWLLEEVQWAGEEEPLQNIFRIPCIFTLRQIKYYSLNGNFDAVSSMLGLPLALGETEFYATSKNQAKNPLASLTRHIKQRIGQ